ncbi:MAG: hypothetical protein J5644_02360 [Bacteroidales bacterium]|nr:hypothetical protein [Bacteroidales bacterium]
MIAVDEFLFPSDLIRKKYVHLQFENRNTMKSKKYKIKESKIPEVGEPSIPYTIVNPHTTSIYPISSTSESLDCIVEKYKPLCEKLKTEADEKYGKKDLMSVDEYFGKLWYIVEGLYEHL